MKSYSFSRRSFLGLIGASAGLHALLRNVEAQAVGAVSPSRLLLTHHPVGTIYNAWLPEGTTTDFTFSQILKPFEEAGLRNELTIIDGMSMDMIGGPGGGHEKGTVIMTTGAPTKLTRTGQSETDDPHADGPSFDQLLLSKLKSLSDAPIQSLQALCDDRIDHQEISTRCLTYSMQRRAVQGVQGAGEENIPIRPTLKPLDLYTRVFGTMMPGGTDAEALAKNLKAKKSVLDFSLRELARLRTLAPASQRPVIDAHEQAIRDMENEIQGLLDSNRDPESCGVLAAPPNIQGGVDDNGDHDNYNGNEGANKADDPIHLQLGRLHQSIITAAFRCDLTRVASFQWSPGTNHIAFGGLWPDNDKSIYQHHPISHRVGSGDFGKPEGSRTSEVQFLLNVEKWYNKYTAEFIAKLKTTTDVYGNPLLDNTIVPYLTEVARATHDRSPIPFVMFGGKNLGFKHGKFLRFKDRPHNDMWLSIGQALGLPLDQIKGQRGVAFDPKTYTGAISELFA